MEYSVINVMHELKNETLKSVPFARLIKIPKDSCQYVMELPYAERCDFVYQTHDCAVSIAPLVNPFKWVFCVFPEHWSFIGVFAMFFTLIILFFLTQILADVFICPNLEVVSDSLNLPENLAGVTILAFGNGAPDLFAAYAGAEMDHSDMMFASLTGSGLFVTTFVAGIILFIRPFKVDKMSFLRNVFFYLCTYSILFVCFYCRYYTIAHALCILGVYSIYIGINVLNVILDSILHKKTEIRITDDEEQLKSMAKERSLFIPSTGVGRPSTAAGYHWKHLKPLFTEFMEEISYKRLIGPKPSHLRKMVLLIEVPLVIGLKLMVPVVNKEERNDGWCKLLVMINLFAFPNLVLYCFDYEEFTLSSDNMRFEIWVVGNLLGMGFVMGIFFFTEAYAKPKYHCVVAYIGFICAIAVIRFVSAQVIFHLSTIGARFTISSSILAITLLSWGNCLVDCVSNTAIAKHGMQNMGLGACFGGPMFNCSLGVGAISILVYLKGTPIQAFYGHVTPVGSLFMFISLLSCLILIPNLNFEGRRCFGIYLILLYVTFLVLCILMEDTIHAFGTQYFKDWASANKE